MAAVTQLRGRAKAGSRLGGPKKNACMYGVSSYDMYVLLTSHVGNILTRSVFFICIPYDDHAGETVLTIKLASVVHTYIHTT